MKIFLDTANVEFIKKWAPTGLIDGVTTNPTLLSKETVNPQEHILAISDLLPSGIINVEVVEADPQKIYTQAHAIAQLANNIAVKIPCHAHYYPVIRQLVQEGIKINITLLFSLTQGLMMAKLGVSYISAFIERLDDINEDGIKLIKELRKMLDLYGYETELLAASIRHTEKLEQVISAGADIATVPISIFEQSITHSLTSKGIEQFLADWKTLHIKQFP